MYPSLVWNLLSVRSLWCFGSSLRPMASAVRSDKESLLEQLNFIWGTTLIYHQSECDGFFLNTATSSFIRGCAQQCGCTSNHIFFFFFTPFPPKRFQLVFQNESYILQVTLNPEKDLQLFISVSFFTSQKPYIWISVCRLFYIHCMQAFLSTRLLTTTTNKNVFLALTEVLQIFSSLVVFPFSFSLVILIQWVHCWKTKNNWNYSLLTDAISNDRPP